MQEKLNPKPVWNRAQKLKKATLCVVEKIVAAHEDKTLRYIPAVSFSNKNGVPNVEWAMDPGEIEVALKLKCHTPRFTIVNKIDELTLRYSYNPPEQYLQPQAKTIIYTSTKERDGFKIDSPQVNGIISMSIVEKTLSIHPRRHYGSTVDKLEILNGMKKEIPDFLVIIAMLGGLIKNK